MEDGEVTGKKHHGKKDAEKDSTGKEVQHMNYFNVKLRVAKNYERLLF